SRRAYDRVDREAVVGIDVEQQVFITLGRGPSRRMRPETVVLHELLEQGLRLLHTSLVVSVAAPDGPQVGDEFVQDRQSCARHGCISLMVAGGRAVCAAR